MCFGVNCPFKKTTLALLHDHSCSSGVKRKGGKEDGCQSLTTASVTAALLMCHHPSVTTAVTSPCHRQSAQRGVPRMSSVSACLCLRWSPSHVLWSLRQWCWLETFSTASKQTNNALHSLRFELRVLHIIYCESSTCTKPPLPTETFQWDRVASAPNSSRNGAELPLRTVRGSVFYEKDMCQRKLK